MTILIDIDDTINNLSEQWIKELKENFGYEVAPGHELDWAITDMFPHLTKEQVYSPINEDDFWRKTTPQPGAVEYIEKLIDDGHEVYIVSATYYFSVKPKTEWILKYFPYLKPEQLIFVHDKSLVAGDIIIDNKLDNLWGDRQLRILISSPRNKKFLLPTDKGWYRTYGWGDTYDAINYFIEKEWLR